MAKKTENKTKTKGKAVSLNIAIVSNSNAKDSRVPLSRTMLQKLSGSEPKNARPEITIDQATAQQVALSPDELKLSNVKVVARSEAFENADIILMPSKPSDEDAHKISAKAIVIGNFEALSPGSSTITHTLINKGVTLFSLDLMPRTSRAQMMDILSSQANLAGYRAVLESCNLLTKAMPMMVTAAGTVKPATVLVMGVGVAGLQAIATAKRLGAVVLATDVRPETKEQVESLAAKFIAPEIEQDDPNKPPTTQKPSSVYASEMSRAYREKQQGLILKTIPVCDIVITTAQIPGKRAPVLVTKNMVHSMRRGSVIYDLAAKGGGNCELSKPGETISINGVTIAAPLNPLQGINQTASEMLAGNYLNFLSLILDTTGKINIDTKDEIIKATMLKAKPKSKPNKKPQQQPEVKS